MIFQGEACILAGRCVFALPQGTSFAQFESCSVGLQSISFRDGYYTEIMSAKTGFAPETLLCDSINPNPLGHR